jgi:hypothetical protein
LTNATVTDTFGAPPSGTHLNSDFQVLDRYRAILTNNVICRVVVLWILDDSLSVPMSTKNSNIGMVNESLEQALAVQYRRGLLVYLPVGFQDRHLDIVALVRRDDLWKQVSEDHEA